MTRSKSKLAILPAAILALSSPQFAQAQSASSLSGLYACEALTTQEAQLACFLAETAKLRAGEVGVAPRAITPPPSPAPRVVAPAEPEFAPLPRKMSEVPKTRTMAIRSTTTSANGKIRFTLENGEVWQQIEKTRVRLGKGAPDELTVKRMSFGSFLGRVNGKRPAFRVRRIE